MRLNYGRTFLLGFGFLGVSVVWAIYNTFLPPIYESIVGSAGVVGVFMTFDNISAIVLQPWAGARSDRTWNRWGRRLPWILLGMPVAGVLLLLVPTAARMSLGLLLGTSILMNMGMAISRSPVISLMPDLTPSQHRSAANGIINLMGGIGGGIALFLGRPLADANPAYPFFLAGAVAIVTPLLLRAVIREPRELPATASDENSEEPAGVGSLLAALAAIVRSRDRSALALLGAIFLFFVAFAGVEALFSLYGGRVLGIEAGVAGQTLLLFLATVIVFALPAGFIAQRWGRRRTILLGLALFGGTLLCIWPLRDLGPIRLLLPLGGIGYALVNVNTLPMVLELGRGRQAGTYTGIYYVASSLAAIAGPPALGFLMEGVGDGTLFLWSALAIAGAIACMLGVRHGEAAGATVIAPPATPAAPGA